VKYMLGKNSCTGKDRELIGSKPEIKILHISKTERRIESGRTQYELSGVKMEQSARWMRKWERWQRPSTRISSLWKGQMVQMRYWKTLCQRLRLR
jgi:hypothetical protein